jgi:very-short-patch-repair endonuclease
MSKSKTYSKKDYEGYFTKPDKERTDILQEMYWTEGLSWGEVADILGTYPNKVRRDAQKLGIKSKTKSEAQKLALANGRHQHPTQGKTHSESVRVKISEGTSKVWEQLSPKELKGRKMAAKQRWEDRDEKEKEEFLKKGIEAVRESSKTGSKLERILQTGLIKAGYKVEFHKEQWVIRTRLQIDIWLPELNIAIEVDGPSHWKDIWGEEKLVKNQIRDSEKDGMLVDRGCIVIRVRQRKKLSNKYQRDIQEKLINKVREIAEDRTKVTNKVIIIE